MAAEELPAAKRAADLSERYGKGIETIRSRADTSVKALGAIGTAAITAIGYAELADFFPNGGPWWAIPILLCGVVFMILAVVLLAMRFQGVSETIITTSDVDETCRINHFGQPEEGTIGWIYDQTARLNGVESLRAYEARAHRLERIAERNSTDAGALRQQAYLIRAEVGATKDRAALFILRDRARSAIFSRNTALLVLLFVAGWYGTATASDLMESRRVDRVELNKKCLELRKEGLDPLPSVCSDIPPKVEEEPSKTAIAGGAAAIAKLWTDCLAEAEKSGEDATACVPLKRALDAYASGTSPNP